MITSTRTEKEDDIAVVEESLTNNQDQQSNPSDHNTYVPPITTTMSDEDVMVMEQMSPLSASPQNILLGKSVRYKQLYDAASAYISAWMLHPHNHQKALGYLINGTNCATGPSDSNTEANLQSLAKSFTCTFGSNETSTMFNTAPVFASTRGPAAGPGAKKRF